MKSIQEVAHLFLLTMAMAVGFVLLGCDRKETILDVDTPGGGVQVDRDVDDGSITVDVDE
ncbi:hypothetical protein [Rubripirellula lacrimiformis]|nr:hypothetical protein [Rubripirellula lacrimiformis]